MGERVVNLLMRGPNQTNRCNCRLCQESRRIEHLTTTRWVRRRTLQRELDGLYTAYFESQAELEMAESHIKEMSNPVKGHP